MSLIRINSRPGTRQLLVFALAWLAFAAFIGWTQWSRGRPHAAFACWGLALAVPLVGGLWREGLRLFYVGLCYATYPIGYVTSSVVLALLYYAILTPTGLLLRLFRHDALQRGARSRAESYWQPRAAERPPESYFNQH